MTTTRPSLTPAHLLLRIASALLGGYAFVWGVVTFSISGLVALGAAYDQARTSLMLLAFLVFLAVFLWAFASPSLIRVWVVLLGGGAALTAGAWAVQRALT